ncbi:MAG: UvrD-helicase domain-containing protein [Verrucomicrobia bacterium]|nr:UvrD-helicase domain-containing protein [Verrucomicrobiota bacterium]
MSRFRLYDLNPEQQSAATHENGPLLILAGAGTGKTRTIVARITWLVSTGTPASKILAVTFTNKAAREMKERIRGMLNEEQADEITASTFHALCVRILRADADKIGYKNNFTIFDEGDQLGLIKKVINRVTAKDEKLDPGLAKNLISKAKNNGWAAPQDDETVIGAVYARYNRELHALNAMDFDDLLVQAVRLLNENQDVRDKWRARYTQMMVDEFQDTNRLQRDLGSLLAAGEPPNVCVVGDDDQSIYGWRGAEVSNILEFEKHFPNPKVIRLEQNYRSTNPILTTANRLIKNNPRRRVKNLWSSVPGGDPVHVVAVADDKTEAEFVVGEAGAIRNAGGIPWEHFAVIYRMNAQSRLLEENLRRMKIPYRLVGGKSFFDRREIKDILATITCLINPQDDISLLRIINTPPRGIGATSVEIALEHSAKAHRSLFETLTDPAFEPEVTRKTAAAIRKFAEDLAAARIHLLTPGADAYAIVNGYLSETGYFEDLKNSCKTPEEALNRESGAKEILNALATHQTKKRGSVQDFLDELSLNREREEDKKEDTTGLTLITLHAAKGLEFPHVFLIGAEDGLLPHERSKSEGTVDEERRLFYVGITRAMKSLTITHCRNRTKFGSAMSCRPSPFLKEIEGDTVLSESHEDIMTRPVAEEDLAASFASLRAMLAAD